MIHDTIPWQDLAECRGMNPDLFYAERGESTREAKAVCAVCPVRQECLDDALMGREKFGVWGGLSERERRKIRSRRPTMQHGTRARYVGTTATPPCRCDPCTQANQQYHQERAA